MRRERERELVIISKYRKSWRVASKKRRSKTFFTAETNVCLDRPLILLLRISCAHTKGTHTHTHTHTYYYRSVYRGSFSRKLMHGLRKFYSNLIVGRNGARAFEIREIRAGVFPRRKRLRYTRIISLWDRRLLSRINVTLSLSLGRILSATNFIVSLICAARSGDRPLAAKCPPEWDWVETGRGLHPCLWTLDRFVENAIKWREDIWGNLRKSLTKKK